MSDSPTPTAPQSSTVPQTPPPARDADGLGPDPLAGLYHMSNTAGVSTQDYVAINTTAIASLLMGFASVLVFFTDLLLVVPAVGIVCALVAMRQIRQSNQTQTGRGLAWAGLILSAAMGLGRGGYDVVNAIRTTADERIIAQITQDLGQDLAHKEFDKAYQRFDETFRQRVPNARFVEVLKYVNDLPRLGAVTSVNWNERHMEIEVKPNTDVLIAHEMALIHYSGIPDPHRLEIVFQKSGDTWQLHDIPYYFPPPKQGQPQQ